jgi:ABC-2 type transport system permease protein
MQASLLMAKYFLKIFSRDRQAIFFVLGFPSVLILVFGISSTRAPSEIEVGITSYSGDPAARELIEKLDAGPVFKVREGSEDELLTAMTEEGLVLAMTLPEGFPSAAEGKEIEVKVDSAQPSRIGLALPALRQALNDIERELSGTQPLFTLTLKDIQAHSLRYIDFLLPGLIAMMLMNISLAGSGSNTVEYRRKGILKRLFVTPLRPSEFIAGVVLARLVLSLLALLVSIAIALNVFDVPISGSWLAALLVVVLGLTIFLSIGFTLGSFAKTQQSIQGLTALVTFPQILLSGIFFPIEGLPDALRPLARMLPLSFVADSLREIVTNGSTLLEIVPSLLGVVVWAVVALVVAMRYFVWKEVAT